MNVFDEIQGSRPEVPPMPLAKRRMIRESLFGIGHDDSTRTISGRSESGAVVSTAPHGTRRPIQKRSHPAGSFAKLGAGLLVFVALGAVVWSYATRDDSVETTEATTTTTSTTTTTTVTPTTVPPVVRTGVSARVPLALPPTLLIVDEVGVAPAAPGGGAMVLGAPDGSEIWIAEFDGDPADPSTLDVRQVGAIGVGVDRDREDGDSASYRPQVPCGFVIVNDAPGQPLDRPPIIDLFSAMSIDGDATIDITLPTDWSVFSIGDSRTTYIVQFQVPIPGEQAGSTETATAPIRMSQVPDGSFAQLMFGGRQLEPVDFLGAPAFIDVGAADPALVSVYWQDDTTVFNASSSALSLADLAVFVESLEPMGVEDWDARFTTAEPEAAAEPSACAPQPNFGPTLSP